MSHPTRLKNVYEDLPRIKVQLVAFPSDAMDLLGKHGVEDTSEQVMGVAQEKEEDGDGQGCLIDAPFGQQTFNQARTPH